eukprot:CAMPEP_0206136466 /NCGR_PEP_ID=MMETSP1473-20131121/1706_1 /ASSEMBLY_ACC=CAM_ASM_001109 /TAXON_ID=1461547 /ORGANISM="Stichococcus sp, Strain RCC1054" /LENGTH=33 /DNA_ID= /DNA_START= /DNA_END= /DNA_ORIENTATION=
MPHRMLQRSMLAQETPVASPHPGNASVSWRAAA